MLGGGVLKTIVILKKKKYRIELQGQGRRCSVREQMPAAAPRWSRWMFLMWTVAEG